jgi:hypothetical protein
VRRVPRAMRSDDNAEGASFGAEAIPGGLSEINATRRGLPSPAATAPRPSKGTPLLGLIALLRTWQKSRADRR